jgi:hypothetical protein
LRVPLLPVIARAIDVLLASKNSGESIRSEVDGHLPPANREGGTHGQQHLALTDKRVMLQFPPQRPGGIQHAALLRAVQR